MRPSSTISKWLTQRDIKHKINETREYTEIILAEKINPRISAYINQHDNTECSSNIILVRDDISSQVKLLLTEDLDGIASEYQPTEILQFLKKAMEKLQLQQKLKTQNISAVVSKDRQYVTFKKNVGDQSVPILQASTVDLTNSKALGKFLDALNDLAIGKAPGAGEMQRNVWKKSEKQVRDVANKYAMANRSKVDEFHNID